MRGCVYSLTKVALLAVLVLRLGLCGVVAGVSETAARPVAKPGVLTDMAKSRLPDALVPAQWAQVERAIDRALAWLAEQQQADGSFPSISTGQPATTSLCVMAFLSRGHQPGSGPYGRQLDRAIDSVLACQLPDGLFSKQIPGPSYEMRQASHTAVYNHAISGLMLGEAYGQVSSPRAQSLKSAIEKALRFTRQLQLRPKAAADKGGWRYLRISDANDSDLSVTAWQLMFLRSAKNAEFDVSEEQIEEAMAYVHRCWDRQSGGFHYAILSGSGYGASRGMAGAGIVSLSMGGQHQTPMARAAGDWLLAHPIRSYGETIGTYDKFIYSTYYCSQGAAQLGGRYWEKFFPPMAAVLMSAQSRNGSWPAESNLAVFGDTLTTALAVLSLTPPYQLLPVYQR